MFQPLSMLRELIHDDQLTMAEYAILTAAIAHTDNRTKRVRASQEMLAEDAKTTVRTVRRFYRSKAFERYFEGEWSGRRLELTWLDTGHNTGQIPDTTPDTVSPLLRSATSTTSAIPYTEEEKILKEKISFLLVDDY